jgi:predicted nucleic acid-binding protein
MIHLDTSAIIEAFTGSRQLLRSILKAADSGQDLGWCTVASYEWLRGPRTLPELQGQEELLPISSALSFEVADAEIAAQLYRSVRRAKTREADLAIAACAIRRNAQLWTLNEEDFRDIPGLRLYRPKA